MPGVVRATVKVKSGDVEVIASDKRTNKKTLRATIEKTNFKVISIEAPSEPAP